MNFTILSRLVLGTLTIFSLMVVMSAYAVVKIGQFNEVTHSVLRINNRTVEHTDKLIDVLLSQVGYEKKYILLKDKGIYDQFLKLKTDFNQSLQELTRIVDLPGMEKVLDNVALSYQHYHSLFNEQLDKLESEQGGLRIWYAQERERLTNMIIGDLERLKISAQQNTTEKIIKLYEAGAEAKRMAVVMTGGFLLLGIALSVFINRSITQPIFTLKMKTREIARGDWKGNLNILSPPELGELANAFNLMCNKLNELDTMKADFFSSVAHELRTPLSTLKMGINLLLEEVEVPITDRQRKILGILEEENQRLIGLINSLLDLSKMEAGMMVYHFEQKNLVPFINQAIKEIGPQVEAKRINLETMVLREIPEVRIDSERILQVLRNLIGNAIKFTPEKGEVKIFAQPFNGGVKVSVADTGPGIPKENLINIFEKFRQGFPRRSPQGGGSGLGLAIAKQIILSHGGNIWVESQIGHGSTFVFVLPA